MGAVIRAPLAKIDLWEIAEFIAKDNLSAAISLLEAIDAALQTLSDFPGMGPRRDELLPGLRSYPVRGYVLFYRLAPGGIELVRACHGARDLDDLFERD